MPDDQGRIDVNTEPDRLDPGGLTTGPGVVNDVNKPVHHPKEGVDLVVVEVELLSECCRRWNSVKAESK